MADARSEIGKALESRLSPEQIEMLMNEILATTKKAWADIVCKSCKQKQRTLVEVPDAHNVTKSLIELANQAWGRPAQAEGDADSEKVVFKRIVNYSGERPSG